LGKDAPLWSLFALPARPSEGKKGEEKVNGKKKRRGGKKGRVRGASRSRLKLRKRGSDMGKRGGKKRWERKRKGERPRLNLYIVLRRLLRCRAQ